MINNNFNQSKQKSIMIWLSLNDLKTLAKQDYRHMIGWKPNSRDYFAKIQQTTGLLSLKLHLEKKQRISRPTNESKNFLGNLTNTLHRSYWLLFDDLGWILISNFINNRILNSQQLRSLVSEVLEPWQASRGVIGRHNLLQEHTDILLEAADMIRMTRKIMNQNQWEKGLHRLRCHIAQNSQSVIWYSRPSEEANALLNEQTRTNRNGQAGYVHLGLFDLDDVPDSETAEIGMNNTIYEQSMVQPPLSVQAQQNETVISYPDKQLCQKLEFHGTELRSFSSEKIIQISKDIIHERSLELNRRIDENRNNPFKIRNMAGNSSQNPFLTVTFIILSEKEVDKVELITNDAPFKSRTLIAEYISKLVYKKVHIIFCTVKLNLPVIGLSQQFSLKLIHPTVWLKAPSFTQKTITVNYNEQVNNHMLLLVEQQKQLEVCMSRDEAIEVIHFALFSSIRYILKNHSNPESQIYNYLFFIFDKIQPSKLRNHILKIMDKLYLSSSVIKRQSKYLLYLICSIFKQDALTYCIGCCLHKRFKFNPKTVLSTLPPNQISLQEVNEIYRMCYIIQRFYLTQTISPEMIQQLFKCIFSISKSKKYLLLELITHCRPFLFSHISEYDIVQNIFKENSQLTVVQYLKFHLGWITTLKEQRQPEKFVDQILAFMDKAIAIGILKGHDKNAKQIYSFPQLGVSDILGNFILTSQQNTLMFLKKTKELYHASEGKIHLLKNSTTKFTFFRDEQFLQDYLKIFFGDEVTEHDQIKIQQIFEEMTISVNILNRLINHWKRHWGTGWVFKFYKWVHILLKKRKLKLIEITELTPLIQDLLALRANRQIGVDILKLAVKQCSKIIFPRDSQQIQRLQALRMLTGVVIYKIVNQNIVQRDEQTTVETIRRICNYIYPQQTVNGELKRLLLCYAYNQHQH